MQLLKRHCQAAQSTARNEAGISKSATAVKRREVGGRVQVLNSPFEENFPKQTFEGVVQAYLSAVVWRKAIRRSLGVYCIMLFNTGR